MQSDAELVNRARDGDREAFSALLRRYEKPVLAITMSILHHTSDAHDAAQDAFVIAYEKLNRLWRPSKFGAWLLQIARRSAFRIRKRRALRSAEPISENLCERDSSSHPNNGSLSAMSERMTRLIAQLPAQERVIVMLRYLNQLEMSEIAAATGRPIGTVTKQMSRAHARLREWLESENENG